MSRDDTNGDSIDRRNVLKSLGIGSVSLLGATGTGAGHNRSDRTEGLERSLENKRAKEAFADGAAVDRALHITAADVREQLAKEGISIGTSREEFDDVRVFPDRDEGTSTAHIVAERDYSSRTVELHVLPQANRTFAFEKTDAGFRRFDGDSVEPVKICNTETYCSGYCQCSATTPCGRDCAAGYEVKERCCKYSDGTTECETLSRTCTYDCPGDDCV